MSTVFPLDPEINDEYLGYRFDGTSWKIMGVRLQPGPRGLGYELAATIQNFDPNTSPQDNDVTDQLDMEIGDVLVLDADTTSSALELGDRVRANSVSEREYVFSDLSSALFDSAIAVIQTYVYNEETFQYDVIPGDTFTFTTTKPNLAIKVGAYLTLYRNADPIFGSIGVEVKSISSNKLTYTCELISIQRTFIDDVPQEFTATSWNALFMFGSYPGYHYPKYPQLNGVFDEGDSLAGVIPYAYLEGVITGLSANSVSITIDNLGPSGAPYWFENMKISLAPGKDGLGYGYNVARNPNDPSLIQGQQSYNDINFATIDIGSYATFYDYLPGAYSTGDNVRVTFPNSYGAGILEGSITYADNNFNGYLQISVSKVVSRGDSLSIPQSGAKISLKGQDGAVGEVGPAGQNGVNGAPGADGVNGVDGISAYETWLNLGYYGSEQDFIDSLAGADGLNAPSFDITVDAHFGYVQTQALVPSTNEYGDQVGWSVALSSDGNTALIGAYAEDTSPNSSNGAAYVYIKSGGTWIEQAKLLASDAASNESFGYSVAISENGNTAAIGAIYETTSPNSGQGAVYIFTRSGSTWTQQQKLLASDAASQDRFGTSIALSSDGDTVLIGTPNEDTSPNSENGAAYVFTRSGSTWTQQQKLLASDRASNDNLGGSVSLSLDGNTAAIGAIYETTSPDYAQGAVYIFTRSGSTWTQQAKLLASDNENQEFFGTSVSLSANGNTLLVGADAESTSPNWLNGAAYVFTRSGSTWTQQQKLLASDAADIRRFGSSVNISADGSTAVFGVVNYPSQENPEGAAYVFTLVNGTWIQEGRMTQFKVNSSVNQYFGASVALSSDGSMAIVGAPSGYGEGSAYVFDLTSPVLQIESIEKPGAYSSNNYIRASSLNNNLTYIDGILTAPESGNSYITPSIISGTFIGDTDTFKLSFTGPKGDAGPALGSGGFNYSQQLAPKKTSISGASSALASVSITTHGYPVFIMATGDAENTTSGGWARLQLFRDSNPIGNIVHVEGSAGSENIPFALQFIDAQATGTYTYSIKTLETAGGAFNFGETNGPTITAIELGIDNSMN